MMQALKTDGSDKNQFVWEIEFTNQMHEKEKEELRKTLQAQRESWEQQMQELSERNGELDARVKEASFRRRELET